MKLLKYAANKIHVKMFNKISIITSCWASLFQQSKTPSMRRVWIFQICGPLRRQLCLLALNFASTAQVAFKFSFDDSVTCNSCLWRLFPHPSGVSFVGGACVYLCVPGVWQFVKQCVKMHSQGLRTPKMSCKIN